MARSVRDDSRFVPVVGREVEVQPGSEVYRHGKHGLRSYETRKPKIVTVTQVFYWVKEETSVRDFQQYPLCVEWRERGDHAWCEIGDVRHPPTPLEALARVGGR